MNVSGIRPYGGFYDYNSILKPQIPSQVSSDTLSLAEAAREPMVVEPKELSQEQILEARSGQTFGAYDFAQQYTPDVAYELKGADSDLRSLDVEKAISDMEKDQAIHQYQFFVGEQLQTNGVNTLRGGEDFSL